MLDKRRLAQILAEKSKLGQINPQSNPISTPFKMPMAPKIPVDMSTSIPIASKKPKNYKFPNLSKFTMPKV